MTTKTATPIRFRDLTSATMWIVLVFSIAVVWTTARDAWWHLHPDHAFAHYTGQTLPPSIRATHYGWSINDNLLHVGHYWILHGRHEDIARFALSRNFVESTEDARWGSVHAGGLFGLPLPVESVVVGYEREQGRNDWIMVYADDLAIYNEE